MDTTYYDFTVTGKISHIAAGSSLNVGDDFWMTVRFPQPLLLGDRDPHPNVQSYAGLNGQFSVGAFHVAAEFESYSANLSGYDAFSINGPYWPQVFELSASFLFHDQTGTQFGAATTQHEAMQAVAANPGGFVSQFQIFHANLGAISVGNLTSVSYQPAPVPEPSSMVLLGLAFLAAAFSRKAKAGGAFSGRR